MNIRKVGGAALLGLTALIAGSASAEAGHRHGRDCGHRGYSSSRGYDSYGRGDYGRGDYGRDYYGRDYHGRDSRSYGYSYRAPRRYYSVRPYYSGRPYYDDYGYDAYYSAPQGYSRRSCRPRSRVGVYFGF